jgi:hypothetical protein
MPYYPAKYSEWPLKASHWKVHQLFAIKISPFPLPRQGADWRGMQTNKNNRDFLARRILFFYISEADIDT